MTIATNLVSNSPRDGYRDSVMQAALASMARQRATRPRSVPLPPADPADLIQPGEELTAGQYQDEAGRVRNIFEKPSGPAWVVPSESEYPTETTYVPGVKVPLSIEEVLLLTEQNFDSLTRVKDQLSQASWTLPDRSDRAARVKGFMLSLVGMALAVKSPKFSRPSLRELGSQHGLSHQTADNYLRELAHHQMIRLTETTITILGCKIRRTREKDERVKPGKERRLELIRSVYRPGKWNDEGPRYLLKCINNRLGSNEKPLNLTDLYRGRLELAKRGMIERVQAARATKTGKKWESDPSAWVLLAEPAGRDLRPPKRSRRDEVSSVQRRIWELIDCEGLAA